MVVLRERGRFKFQEREGEADSYVVSLLDKLLGSTPVKKC